MAAWLLLLLPLHYGWRLFGRPSPWPQHFLRGVGWIAGLRYRISGTPLKHHVLFVANHESWLDILALAGASGTAFVSKAEVGRWPVIGWLANIGRTIYVERADRGAVRGQADAIRVALERGERVALFPEGTTDGGVAMLPFRPSLLASLYPPIAGVQVQPVAIDYGANGEEIAWVGGESAKSNVSRILKRGGSLPVHLTFLAPLDPAALADRKALASAAQDAIAKALPASGHSQSAL